VGTIEPMENNLDSLELEKSPRKLRRSRDGKLVAGVCAGVGGYLGVDPNLIRVGLAVFSFFGGSGVGLYVLAWLVLPEEGKQRSIAQDLIDNNKDNPKVQEAMAKTRDTLGSMSKR
jgi:phage shock protein PspC (stress-responsive transcriptional regulator)